MKTNAYIYARVSTAEQQKEGFSIQAQLKMLRGYAKKNGFSVVREFVDSETARSTGRTGFNEMLVLLAKKNGCKTILVEKTDRLTRNMKDYLALDLEKTGLEIHFVREGKVMSRHSSPTEFFMQDIEIAQAAYLSRNISSEAKKGMKAKAESGFYPSVAPLGYSNTANSNGIKIIAPDPLVSPMILKMFERYSRGSVPIHMIVQELFDAGVRSKRGNKIGVSTVHKMLSNPIYRGKFIWNGREYQGNHTPIVSAELWFNVQDVLLGRRVSKPKQRYEFSYTGLMQCSECGCAITAERRKNKYTYYHCTEFKGKHGDPYIRQEKLDMQFSHILKGLRIDDRIAKWIVDSVEAKTADKRKTLEETKARLVKQRDRLQRRSDVLYDDRLDGRIDVIVFDRKSAEIRREIELVDEKLSNLDSSYVNDLLSNTKGIIELSQKANRLFLTVSGSEKKQFLKKLLSNCTLDHGTVKPEFTYPLGVLFDTNTKWKASGALSSDLCAVHSYWHPGKESNSKT
ncbi:MAG: recombinase family protein [Candidatus Sabulitectum sp.]|nr:recombinase family protein [Candidatus Sabulitectum sp.]